ncbi:MAG: serine/threonine protein kinase, partial [Gammaproteobacteria bacterium]|nr:serine/threonine protein kinase [Gammaproteobacteria bacterium]
MKTLNPEELLRLDLDHVELPADRLMFEVNIAGIDLLVLKTAADEFRILTELLSETKDKKRRVYESSCVMHNFGGRLQIEMAIPKIIKVAECDWYTNDDIDNRLKLTRREVDITNVIYPVTVLLNPEDIRIDANAIRRTNAMIMPKLSGVPLSEDCILALDMPTKIRVIKACLIALQTFYNHGYVMHGDLKPENFIYDSEQDLAYLIDFSSCLTLADFKGAEFVSPLDNTYASPEMVDVQEKKCFGWASEMFPLAITIARFLGLHIPVSDDPNFPDKCAVATDFSSLFTLGLPHELCEELRDILVRITEPDYQQRRVNMAAIFGQYTRPDLTKLIILFLQMHLYVVKTRNPNDLEIAVTKRGIKILTNIHPIGESMISVELSEFLTAQIERDFTVLQQMLREGTIAAQQLEDANNKQAGEFARHAPQHEFFLTSNDIKRLPKVETIERGITKLNLFRAYLEQAVGITDVILRERAIAALIQGAKIEIDQSEKIETGFAYVASNVVNENWLPQHVGVLRGFGGVNNITPKLIYNAPTQSLRMVFQDEVGFDGAKIGLAKYSIILFADLDHPTEFTYQLALDNVRFAGAVADYFGLQELAGTNIIPVVQTIMERLHATPDPAESKFILLNIILNDRKGLLMRHIFGSITDYPMVLDMFAEQEYVLQVREILLTLIEQAEDTDSFIRLQNLLALLGTKISPTQLAITEPRYILTKEELMRTMNQHIKAAIVENDWCFCNRDEGDSDDNILRDYLRGAGVRINNVNAYRRRFDDFDGFLVFLQEQFPEEQFDLIYKKYRQEINGAANLFAFYSGWINIIPRGVVSIYRKDEDICASSVLYDFCLANLDDIETNIDFPGCITSDLKLIGGEHDPIANYRLNHGIMIT